MLPLLLLVVALPTVAGCGRHGGGMFAAGIVTGAVIVAASQPRHVIVYEPAPAYVYVPEVYVPPPPPPARERPAGPPPPAFDIAAARSSLASVDLAPCRAAGVPAGYGHARVTFGEAGNVTKVIVDSPSGLSPEAVSCVGQRLGTAEVPAFVGREVSVPTTWLVRER
jgi:hypothetical protein